MTWQLLGVGGVGLLVTIRALARTISHHLLVRQVVKKGGGARIEIHGGSTIIYGSDESDQDPLDSRRER